ncbi:hypothetical protein [Bradyrhizobium sp. sGM-13]|uniref:hypothetical protein n=1 Tax=Bradyrhizobium sp. sGM-13 TaxID=2831781 RepID=UPI001BCB79E5|nr:hypothetical protein [Bradyrhizobium sp. sGM-13]
MQVEVVAVSSFAALVLRQCRGGEVMPQQEAVGVAPATFCDCGGCVSRRKVYSEARPAGSFGRSFVLLKTNPLSIGDSSQPRRAARNTANRQGSASHYFKMIKSTSE